MAIEGEVAALYTKVKPLLSQNERKHIEEYLTADVITGGSACVCFIKDKWGSLHSTRKETLKMILSKEVCL